jgi:general stress protein CsbA
MALSGTTYGYVLTAIGFLLYVLLFNRAILFNKYVAIALVFILSVFPFLYKYSFDQYTVNKLDLVTNVIHDPESIKGYLEKDGSAFQRVMNPYIAFKSVSYSYGFGTGLDTYRYVYPQYILSEYRYALKHQSVREAVEGKNYITPKSLYGKIFTEIGVLPFAIFSILIFYGVYRIGRISTLNPDKLFVECAMVIFLLYGINNDSIIFVNSYILIYMIYYLTKTRKIERVNGS